MIWIFLLIFSLLILGLSTFFLIYKTNKLLPIENKHISRLLSILIIFIIGAVLCLILNYVNMFAVFIHLIVFWIITDIVFILIKKQRKTVMICIIALITTFAYLSYGYYNAYHVLSTSYNIKTEKNIGNLKIIQFADSHIGTTFSGNEFRKYTLQMQKENPDVVVITGDFIDDRTSKKDMIDACSALSELRPKFGTYFAFGNHDKGYLSDKERGFSNNDLINELSKNNVVVLQDESVLIDNRFYIIGRKDKIQKSRASIDNLTVNLDKSKYLIVLDHQPADYDNEEKANVDLVLSGHTHGGQLFPLQFLTDRFNEKTYGLEKRGKTNFIVTSGISDWTVKFKTGTKAEYVVIQINE